MSDIPEADAMEQLIPVGPDTEDAEPRLDPEVPEADAIEQSHVIGDDEDAYPR